MAFAELLKAATVKVVGYPVGGLLFLAGLITFASPNAGMVNKVVSVIAVIIGVALWLAASRS